MFYQTIDFPVLKRCYLQKHMANQVDLLEEQLRRVEGRSWKIVDAATNRTDEGSPAETWRTRIVQLYGDEDTLFRRTLIDWTEPRLNRLFPQMAVFVSKCR